MLMRYCIFISAYSSPISSTDSIIRAWRNITSFFPSATSSPFRRRVAPYDCYRCGKELFEPVRTAVRTDDRLIRLKSLLKYLNYLPTPFTLILINWHLRLLGLDQSKLFARSSKSGAGRATF
jgi:hypothetical protein